MSEQFLICICLNCVEKNYTVFKRNVKIVFIGQIDGVQYCARGWGGGGVLVVNYNKVPLGL